MSATKAATAYADAPGRTAPTINVFALKSAELERLMRDVELGREIDEETLRDMSSRRVETRG